MEYWRSLSALRASDEPRFGGKSAALGELLAAGVPVPSGFALSTDAFRSFVSQSALEAGIERRLGACDPEDVEALGAACAGIRETLGAVPLPAAIADEVQAAYAELGRPPVAVRSSALGEDSAAAAFAGQQETFLWVRDSDQVVAAIRDCWASLYTTRAVSYRAKLGRVGVPPAMGVAVQEMIDARVSGVMFTCSPASGDPSVIAVNASWGLGEAVVAGEVTPDELLVSKVTGEVIRETVSEKAIEHVPAPQGGGTVAREVEPERRRARCLSDDELQALLGLASRIERHFGSHQDVEWAIARRDGVSILQSRPVTVAQRKHVQAPAEPASAISLVMSAFGVKQ
jgi:pyruvate, water dikinase